MKHRVKPLSPEEMSILEQMDNDELRALREWRETPSFLAMSSMVNLIIEYERNYIFSLNEASMTPTELALKHAYSRGMTSAGVKILRLVSGAQGELGRREEAKRKREQRQE